MTVFEYTIVRSLRCFRGKKRSTLIESSHVLPLIPPGQYQRNQQQEQSFRRAMQQMHMLYAHNSTTTLRIETLTPEPQLQRCRSEGRQIWAFVAGQLQLVSLKDLRFEDDHPDAGCGFQDFVVLCCVHFPSGNWMLNKA